MTESNPITGEVVILAPPREKRPNVYDGAPCPFCPGAEEETPPEIARDGDPWRIRVFPNRYPPTEHAEVIVESASHDATFDVLDAGHAQRIVEIYFERYRALAATSSFVCIFKNHGRLAGASIPHLHSQIVGLPFIPPRVAVEGEAFARAAACPLCDLSAHPLIRETEHYRWIAPRGGRFAYQQWIVPKTHGHQISEPHELAMLMQASVRSMQTLSDAFTWSFINFPHEPRGHWYVELFPRTAMIAGLETGTGTFVVTLTCDETAAILRSFL
ncbi:MAG: UDPglucose--hexose-phosphate uridylyltransferase [Thermoanaerobaculia bacterium]|nr:UDPglucose--hexose-phosphate uridylyltransferase [Thermoanaerobaculia bacterium]